MPVLFLYTDRVDKGFGAHGPCAPMCTVHSADTKAKLTSEPARCPFKVGKPNARSPLHGSMCEHNYNCWQGRFQSCKYCAKRAKVERALLATHLRRCQRCCASDRVGLSSGTLSSDSRLGRTSGDVPCGSDRARPSSGTLYVQGLSMPRFFLQLQQAT